MGKPIGSEERESVHRRVRGFQDLMPERVQDILLVSSLYESFILSEDGQLNELILSEFLDLNLHHTPGLTRLSTGARAIELAREQPRFNLIITTIRPQDMNAAELARQVSTAGLDIPVVMLAFDNRELSEFLARHDTSDIDRIFLWQGDVRILLAIVKYVEDKKNVWHDARLGDVQVILVVEDSVRYYSSFLPMIYTEVVAHSQRLISEGVNLSHKILRMRARPKILLCTTYEEAWDYFTQHAPNVLGIVSDIEFPRADVHSPDAGLDLARIVKRDWPDVPILLQSSRPENAPRAQAVGADFLLKGSATLLYDLRRFMVDNFAFGDFIFRTPDGREVARAHDLKSLEEGLRKVPPECIAYHGERNHFSNWLKARTEFALAHRLRPRQVSDFSSVEHIRRDLIAAIGDYRRDRHRGVVADFDPSTFDASSSFSRIGGGSLGGKARGLAFVRRMLDVYWDPEDFPDIRVSVPPAVVLGTDVFDLFLEQNDLRGFAINCADDAEILRRFEAAAFPVETRRDLRAFLEVADFPLAVRSSSLLEDSQYQPFTGVYETFMLPNHDDDLDVRLAHLLRAVKRVYASTFSIHAKNYLRVTPYRLEEEKMAVIVQKIVGAAHDHRFYPDFSGVARSYNFYPTEPMSPEDGIVAAGFGLGRTVVEGGNCVRFCPSYPRHLMPFASLEDALDNSQRTFWALQLHDDAEMREARFDLDAAENDGTLASVASTYCPENQAMYDGVSRSGVRVVTFAPVLKQRVFPLAELTRQLLDIGQRGMANPVEIEFAVRMSSAPGEPKEFGFLQMRPLVLSRETEQLDLDVSDSSRLVCHSPHVLGSGRLEVRDVVVVDPEHFDRSRSRETAAEVARFNSRLVEEEAPYLLIGVGRWGSTDPWLGIPVTWDEIAGARAIIEAGFKDFRVTPSQGTHFFQNLASFQVGYFTVNADRREGFVDWAWLARQPAVAEGTFARHLRFDRPILVKMNGTRKEGIVCKPGASG
jgi:CheY-like chemotaxis protein